MLIQDGARFGGIYARYLLVALCMRGIEHSTQLIAVARGTSDYGDATKVFQP
jgi:hypothetical protein